MDTAQLCKKVMRELCWDQHMLASRLGITITTIKAFLGGRERKTDSTRQLIGIAVKQGLLAEVVEYTTGETLAPEMAEALSQIGEALRQQRQSLTPACK